MKTAARTLTTHQENILHFARNVEDARRAFGLADEAARVAIARAHGAKRALKDAERRLLETQAGH